jgi:hypothetical protein
LPKLLFKAECAKCSEGLDTVETLANVCFTSLTATAIRFAKLCDDPVAVVCSKGDRVQFATPIRAASSSLRDVLMDTDVAAAIIRWITKA